MVKNITFSAGYITVTFDSGPPVQYPIADMLRSADIPTGLTYSQVAAISTLANLVVVLIRTLIDRDILDDKFLEDGDYDLDDVADTISNLGGKYGEPDLSVNDETVT